MSPPVSGGGTKMDLWSVPPSQWLARLLLLLAFPALAAQLRYGSFDAFCVSLASVQLLVVLLLSSPEARERFTYLIGCHW